MKKLTINVLIGPIASGKSTFVNNKINKDCVVINDDSIVNMLHGGNYKLYNKELKPLYKSIENHIINFAIALGKTIIIDRGVDVRIKSRKRWIALGNSLDVRVNAFVFPVETPEIHAKRRFESDSRGLSYNKWLNCGRAHINQFVYPTWLSTCYIIM